MNKVILTLTISLLVAACGFKGDLYLPREKDDAKFGAIQTGINLKRPDAMRKRQQQPTQTPSASEVISASDVAQPIK